ncbi:phage tail sheath subtilisin-like domain-containing protein [Sedimentitalea sp. JM2-8]|uniref:Phage tail sheath subtilisin-like domain-containing protein n=1 Tax=Sedimentitalea xiamensis TaxID=3050037 RepID=A0ABT7FEJ9_9RHOB|nr:phage tail sheath subtilisin-like domain-containing protein [Sedimentitalea xiamensis]MDK3073552.1 phage tail sheath subtilisin-like domain-containing protein [Sedimentitalea xiamensis]
MTTPLTPGVYVSEAPGGARSIEAAPTAVTIFVGETERGPVGPTPITSAIQYRRLFGGYLREDAANTTARLFMPFAVQGFFDNGGPRAYVLRLVNGTSATSTLAVGDGTDTAAINARAAGAWGDNIRIAIVNATDGDADRFNLHVFYQAPGEANHTEVELFEGLSADPLDEKYIVDQLARSAFVTWSGADVFRPDNDGDPAATPPGTALAGGDGGDGAVAATGYAAALAALDGLDDAALIVCGSDLMLNAADAAEHNGIVNALLAYVEARPQRDLFLVADAPRSIAQSDPVGAAVTAARSNINASDHLGLYWPRIVVGDPIGLGRNPQLAIPAAGHVAGLYGRTDGRRGVWKAAAGVEATVAGATGLDFNVIDRDQDRMNPHGLNAIRTVPGAGRVVWGARTRRPTTEWRYVNVRRTAMFLRRSIYNGIQWAVFEGNDETLWAALRQSIGAFMDAQFRNGAFAGATAREAYFVKCDSDTTTPDDQASGVVNVQVGFAPLRPAEFVIVTLSQKTATS